MDLDLHADAFLLSERELKILLAGMDHSTLFGMLTDQAAENREKKNDVYQTLFDMVRLDKIRSDGDAFSVSEPIRSYVRQIGSAENVFLINMPEEGYPLCCYAGEKLVVCSRVEYQPQILRLREVDPAVLLEEVCAAVERRVAESEGAELSDASLWQDSAQELFAITVYRQCRYALTMRVTQSPLSPAEIETEQADQPRGTIPYQADSFRNLLQFYLKEER